MVQIQGVVQNVGLSLQEVLKLSATFLIYRPNAGIQNKIKKKKSLFIYLPISDKCAWI
jgi:hypothetical protein